ncbi:GCN5-like N-acetyltransferase [Gottschalkia purinilytica]|uniref:GCN5-like N-acetyltransferase n=1 Tax=Gottschalkia purinilytica TaxID=1503 RepID=A0A0L0W7K3_GOTPU|nr:GNAT family N-acetyltransferase [Gottschalkia purinilytica]KNF07437.1 GCN5-like N-acetyltransferase [Gottschalkia purinilytica]
MITIKKLSTEEEKENLNLMLKHYDMKEDINKNDIIHIMLDNGEIIGATKISSYNSIEELIYIIIREDKRGEDLGDGLLRGAFNYCLNKGIKNIYYFNESKYLLKKGFVEAKKTLDMKNHIPKDSFLVCNIENLFSKSCRSKRSE